MLKIILLVALAICVLFYIEFSRNDYGKFAMFFARFAVYIMLIFTVSAFTLL